MHYKTDLEYQMAMIDLLLKIQSRRMYALEASETCQHIIYADTDSLETIQKIIDYTSGRVMLGMRAVAFEDGTDATAFKLVI